GYSNYPNYRFYNLGGGVYRFPGNCWYGNAENCPNGCKDGACIKEKNLLLVLDDYVIYHINDYPNKGDLYIAGKADISWNKIENAKCYNIYQMTKNSDGSVRTNYYLTYSTCWSGGGGANQLNYDTTGLSPDAVWFYKIAAVDQNNKEFLFSNEINFKFSDWCIDSDNGKNYYTKGRTNDQGELYPYYDECIDSSNLKEYFCVYDTNRVKKYYKDEVIYHCPNGCKDGACIKCTDSDGGKNYYEKGTCTDARWSGDDYCVGNVLHEVTCEPDNFCTTDEEGFVCTNGCQDGACVEEEEITCSDTDGGINYYKKGTTTETSIEGTQTRSDSCSLQQIGETDENGKIRYKNIETYSCSGIDCHLRENYCRDIDNALSNFGVICPGGCKDGACLRYVQSEACVDTDGGNDIYEKGVVYYKENSQVIGIVDACRLGSGGYYAAPFLMEYTCGSDNKFFAKGRIQA
ncbi:unnamed protein product, partial [marine sediment metagenome]